MHRINMVQESKVVLENLFQKYVIGCGETQFIIQSLI